MAQYARKIRPVLVVLKQCECDVNPHDSHFRSDVLGSYSSTPSDESIKYIDEDVSMTVDVVETCAEIHPIPTEVVKSPKSILKARKPRSPIDREQQQLDRQDKVVIVPSLKLETEPDFLEDDNVFFEAKRYTVKTI